MRALSVLLGVAPALFGCALTLFGFVADATAQGRMTAPSYSLAQTGCVNPGDRVDLRATASGFGRRPYGQFLAVGRTGRQVLTVLRWSSAQITVRLPSTAQMRPRARFTLQWARPGASTISIGRVTVCGGATVDRTAPSPAVRRARPDEVPAPDGSAEYVVAVAPGQAAAAQTALEQLGATVLRTRQLPALARTLLFVVLPPTVNLAAAQNALTAAGTGALIDAHTIYGFAEGPRLYAASLVGAPKSGVCGLARPVRIGVIDGPVDPKHPAFAGVSLKTKSFLPRGRRPASAAHGTAVAALIGGARGHPRFAGFAPGAELLAAGAFGMRGQNGRGAFEAIAAGLNWLVGQGARLVNMSFAGPSNRVFEDLIGVADRRGVILIAAAGNEGSARRSYPAGVRAVIAVTAIDAAGRRYRKANRGAHIEFSAPGVDLFVAKSAAGGYASGTSYSAPIVTALAAHAFVKGAVSKAKLRAALRGGARDLGPAGRDADFGWGLVQMNPC